MMRSIPTQYLNQGLSGKLGKYQVDATSLEKMGFLKSGTVAKAKSAADAINKAANWTGAQGIKSKTDFLTNPNIQETVVAKMFEDNYQLLSKTIPNFSKLTDSEVAGLLQVCQFSGVSQAQDLLKSFGGKLPNISSLPGLPKGLAVNPADIAGQFSPSCFFGMLPTKFLPAQMQAMTAQVAKVTSKLPVSIPGPLQKLVGPAAALQNAVKKVPGLDKIPGGMQSLTKGVGGLTNPLGGVAGVVNKLPGGFANVPGNLTKFANTIPSVANKLPGGLSSKTSGLMNGFNKVNQVIGKMPPAINKVAGTVPNKLLNAIPSAPKALSVVQQYQAGYSASELGKRIAKA